MSEQPSPVTDRHLLYIESHTTAEDDTLRTLKREALAAGLPSIWISPTQASFLQIVLRAARVRTVVEVGTLAGYSAIVMARALPEDGRVRTIEINAAHAAFARRWIARSDVAAKIELLEGVGLDVLRAMPDLSADAAFLDADKESYGHYLRECLRIVRRGGLIFADNAFAFGELFAEQPTERSVYDIRAFNELMARERALQGVIVPLGDGLWMAVRR